MNNMRTIETVSKSFGISELGVWTLIRQKKVKSSADKLIGHIFVDIKEVEEYFSENPLVLENLREIKK